MKQDFNIVYNGGSVSLVFAKTRAAKKWLAEHCPRDESHHYFGQALAVESRYIDGLCELMEEDGLTYEL